jgi:hypothetical protein
MFPGGDNKEASDTAFSQQNELMVAVVDGTTSELAAFGATELAAQLSTRVKSISDSQANGRWAFLREERPDVSAG